MTNFKIILASSSPRRQKILAKLGVDFTSISPDIDESVMGSETPSEYVQRLAIAKAQAVVDTVTETYKQNTIVIGGDVTVDFENQSIGKAETVAEAQAILARLSGNKHFIRDGYAVFLNGALFNSGVSSAEITFKSLSENEIVEYTAGLEWQGKAGAYAFQEKGGQMVATALGSYFDIVGLPVFHVAQALMALGVEIESTTISQIWIEDKALMAKALGQIYV